MKTHDGEIYNSRWLSFAPRRVRMTVHTSLSHRHGGTLMLTDYAAHCPHEGCGYRGHLFPQGNREDFRQVGQTHREMTFVCPRCTRPWRAQVVGEDAVNLPLEQMADSTA